MRDAWLDGLRALAALMVFVHHASPGTYVGGWDAGVLVFFSLSGYLLYRPFLERAVDLRAYAIRRLLRIVPAYLVAVLGIAWLHGYEVDPVGVLTISRTPIVVAWTLQIEVVFYAALPAIAWLGRGQRTVLYALAAVSLLAGAATAASTGLMPIAFPFWVWAFVPGMAVAQLAVRRPDILALAARSIVPLVGVALMSVSIVPNLLFPDIPAAVGSALLLAWLLTRAPAGPRMSVACALGGALSYSFYLWHEALMAPNRPPSIEGALIAFALTSIVAGVVYVTIEAPAIRLSRRLTAPRRPRPIGRPARPIEAPTELAS